MNSQLLVGRSIENDTATIACINFVNTTLVCSEAKIVLQTRYMYEA